MANQETVPILGRARADRTEISLSATFLFLGILIFVVAGLLHPAQAPANDNPAIFAEYAASTRWAAVHLAQFIGTAMIIAGLLVLRGTLDQLSWAAPLGGLLHLLPWRSTAFSRQWTA